MRVVQIITPEQIEHTFIKEKFGGLRFSFWYKNEYMPDTIIQDIIFDIQDIVEDRSFHICEFCGDKRTAKLRNDLGWKKTLCDSCHEKKKADVNYWGPEEN